MNRLPEPLYLDGPNGRIFLLHFSAGNNAKGAILHLPAFGEEMNRCRYTVAVQARKFNELGYDCLLLDPVGTGDSEGELSDASWTAWINDAIAAADWLDQRSGKETTLWGMRLGALLASNLCQLYPQRFDRLLFWQPVLDGKMFVTQYLRLRVAYLMDKGLPAETTDGMRAAMSAGDTLEVAGYPLSSALCREIDGLRMIEFDRLDSATIDWCERVSDSDKPLPLASKKAVEKLQDAGCTVQTSTFTGPPIWSLHNRDELPGLVELTTSIFGARS